MYINPRWIITEFLRSRLIDPREDRRAVEKVINYVSEEGQKEFDLEFSEGKNLSHIESVKVNGDVLSKWQHYAILFRKRKIYSMEGLSSGDNVEIVLYECERSWIYWDRLYEKLKSNQFPRIVVTVVSTIGDRLGNFEAPVETSLNVQFDIYGKQKSNDNIFYIDGDLYAGEELVERLGYDLKEAFEKYEIDLHPALYDYVPNQMPPGRQDFDDNIQAHHRLGECELSGIDVGKLFIEK